MFPKAQSIYWSFALNLSSIADSTLSMVNLHHRRNSTLVNSVCETALGLHLCTRIWVRAMIGLLKKPLSICQSRRKEIWNALPVILWVLGGQHKDIGDIGFADLIVCYTAVFSVVPQRMCGGALRDDTKNGCVADYRPYYRPRLNYVCEAGYRVVRIPVLAAFVFAMAIVCVRWLFVI